MLWIITLITRNEMIMCLIDCGTNEAFLGMVMINFVLMIIGWENLMNKFCTKHLLPWDNREIALP